MSCSEQDSLFKSSAECGLSMHAWGYVVFVLTVVSVSCCCCCWIMAVGRVRVARMSKSDEDGRAAR